MTPIAPTLALLLAASVAFAAADTPPGFSVLGSAVPAEWADLKPQPDWELGRIEEDPGRATTWGNTEMPPVKAADTARGFITFPKSTCDLVFPQTAPTARELGGAVSIMACPGEYEPFTVCVRALADLPALRATMTGLACAEGRIPSANVDVRTVRVMPRAYAWSLLWIGKLEKKYVMRPLVLERRESVKVPAGTTQQIWVTVRVPDGTPAGGYHATLKIEGGQGGSANVPVALQVLPFRLEEPDVTYCMYHMMNTGWAGCFHDRPGEFRRHLIDMREHGMNSDLFSVLPVVEKKDGKMTVDVSRAADPGFPVSLEEAIQTLTELGMTRPMVWYMAGLGPDRGSYDTQEAYEKDYLEVIRLIEEERKKRGWPEFIYSPDDESDASPERAEACKTKLELLKRAGVRTYLTVIGNPERQVYLPFTDVPTYATTVFRGEFIEEAQKAGKTLAAYNGGSRFGTDPKTERLWYGLWNARVGAKLLTSWAYQWDTEASARSPFDAFCDTSDHAPGYYYSYPTTDGLLPTVAWEGVREGIDDAKYIHTLRQCIARAEASGSAEAKRDAQEAEADLQAALDRVDINQENKYWGVAIRTQADSMTGADFDRHRRRWIRHIMRLREHERQGQ